MNCSNEHNIRFPLVIFRLAYSQGLAHVSRYLKLEGNCEYMSCGLNLINLIIAGIDYAEKTLFKEFPK